MSSIPKDKLLHSFYGMVIFIITLVLSTKLIALGVVAIVAIVKEVYDQWRYKGADWKDVVATVLIPLLLVMVI